MLSVLDQMVANVTSNGNGPVILSEQHDATTINFVAGMTDPGEMIRCGYRPELRRRQGETDEAYAERIRPLVLALPLEEQAVILGAAIKRAGLDDSTGKIALAVAGEPAWHGLGVRVADAMTSADAIRLARLSWTVSKRKMRYESSPGEWHDDGETWSITRDDTGAKLATVGSRYAPIQNAEAFDFMDKLLGEHDARYESAGACYGGRTVFMLLRLPKQDFTIGGRDLNEAYALFSNTHDGTGAGRCFATNNRVVCGNTHRAAIRGGKGKGITIRHTGDIKTRLRDAQNALGLAVEAAGEFKSQAEAMSVAPLLDAEGYFNGVLDSVLDVTLAELGRERSALERMVEITKAEADMKHRALVAAEDRRASLLNDMVERYESERCGLNGQRGTVWAGFNAVTEHADHSPLYGYRGNDHVKASRRFESATTGDGDAMKQVALAAALKLAR